MQHSNVALHKLNKYIRNFSDSQTLLKFVKEGRNALIKLQKTLLLVVVIVGCQAGSILAAIEGNMCKKVKESICSQMCRYEVHQWAWWCRK